jgi:hypothetical protein
MFVLAGLARYDVTVYIEGYDVDDGNINFKDDRKKLAPQIGFGGRIYFNDNFFFKSLFKYSKLEIEDVI